jgi:PTH1 family peptidyl-tRNA hydrolase
MDRLVEADGESFDTAPANALVARLRWPSGPVLVVKPLTMMNLSGEAVGALARYYRIETPDILVVADDVSLPLGRLRARARGSSGGHNGFKSITQHLGTDEWARLRIGVGRGDDRRDLADHVLATFEADEREEVKAMVERAADAVRMFAEHGIAAVMNRFNAGPAEEHSERSDSTTDSQD